MNPKTDEFHSDGSHAMLRSSEWKLCLYADKAGELYDLINDPQEQYNLFDLVEVMALQRDMQTRLIQAMLRERTASADQ